MNREFISLLKAVQNKDIELINDLYTKIDISSLVLLLEYIKCVTEEKINEELSYFRELNFYTKGMYAHYYYTNKKREKYRYLVKIDEKLLLDFEIFKGGM